MELRHDSAVTREQMATFFARYAAWSGLDVQAAGDLSGYTDAGNVSGWALVSMTWAVEKGLITGMTDTTLEPAGFTTRTQAAAVLMRFCDLTK